ncbi:MAG TPA: SRPBCC domain-containing protein [Acidimicrobiia bacterium]|nr:SRPBCC domain-containing protein [Acidimicrobiia bacterium]
MIEPILVEIEVRASPDQAFDVWTSQPTMWWPKSQSVSRDPELNIVFEPSVGGRIYEQTSDGTEHDWGEVTMWEPPHRVSHTWHLFPDTPEATEVTVTFEEVEIGTVVRLMHSRFDQLPADDILEARNRTKEVWSDLVAHFQGAFSRD